MWYEAFFFSVLNLFGPKNLHFCFILDWRMEFPDRDSKIHRDEELYGGT